MSETDTAKSYAKEYTYDSSTNRLTKTKDFATGIEYSPVYKSIKTTVDGTTTYRMDPSDTVVGVEVTGKFTDKTELDPLGRPEKRPLTLASQSNPFLTDTYAYKTFQYGSGNKSALVIVGEQKQEYRVVENGESSTKTATWHYAYDADIDEDTGCLLYNTGNIKSESGTGIDDVEYTYDNLNRLIQEDRGNRLTTVTYDNYGNILTKYCNNGTSYTFGYGEDTGWKDLLTSINGQRVFYDGCYNPTYYRTFIFEWNNIRQLTWCRNTDGNALKDTTFAYGSDGIRCRKNNIYYTLDGNRILKEYNQDTGKTITYLYGEKGIVGFNYDGNNYYYRKDIHGDVLAIYDTNGNVVASYQYDAWGKLIGQTDNSGIGLATLNPIRYRSYYYDTETGFYYLNARYYDPEIGRFLNADSLDYLSDGEDLKNYNLFAYCENNPVMYCDPTGHAWETVFDILSLGCSIIEVSVNPTDPWAWAGLVGDAVDLVPFVTGVGEATRGIKVMSRALDGVDNIVDTAKAAKRTMSSSVGSYEILYKSGMNYVGKGSFDRAIHSAIVHAKPNKLNNFLGDTVVSIRWKAASDNTQAFLEEFALQTQRGVNNKSTYNIIWSPGRKLYDSIFR